MVGLRVPGGYIDLSHPEGILNDRYFRGSGTSEAAAITSGAVALLLVSLAVVWHSHVRARELRAVTWRIGFHDTAPFLFCRPSGEASGFARDVMDQAALRAGLKLQWVYIPQGASAAFESDVIDLYPRSSLVAGLARAPYITAPWFE